MTTTIIFDARLTTVTDEDGNDRDVPDVGPTLRAAMTQTGPGIWTGSLDGYVLAMKALADLTGGPNPRLLYSGQCNQATFDLLQSELTPAQVNSGKQAYADNGRRAEMLGLARRVRRKSDDAIVAFTAEHVIAGEDYFASSLDDGDDPDDFEEAPAVD